MIISDSRQRYYMREIAQLLASKSSETLGTVENEVKKTDLAEMKRVIGGASSDETRLVRALDRIVDAHGLERDGFGWKTTPHSAAYFREVMAA